MRILRLSLTAAAALLSLATCLALLLGYWGLFPAISACLGSTAPRAIAPAPDGDELREAMRALSFPDSPADYRHLLGARRIKTGISGTITAGGLTALIGAAQDAQLPLDNLRIRFPADGVAEASAMIRGARLTAFIDALDMPYRDEALQLIESVGLDARDRPLYARAEIEIRDGKLSLRIERLEIGRLPVPAGILEGLDEALEEMVRGAIGGLGVSIDTLLIEGGRMTIDGTQPGAMLAPWQAYVSEDR